MAAEEYNPLDYQNLTKNCVQELMSRGPFALPLQEKFDGAGVYALFYKGAFAPYRKISSPDATWPIYVGKAAPPGSRKGAKSSKPSRALYGRIGKHVHSIQSVQNLKIEDFLCRYLVVTPLWITMAERFLIEHYQSIWNVCIEGFGIHDPGKGRLQGMVSWWDALHPGRDYASKLQQTRSDKEAKQRLLAFLEKYRPGDPNPPPLPNDIIERALEEDEGE